MIKRQYFFTIEVIPPLRAERIEQGKVTIVSGFVHNRSFFSNPEKTKYLAMKKVCKLKDLDLNEEIIIATGFTRV